MLGAEHDLGFSKSVTDVNENDTAQIAAHVYPTCQGDGFADVLKAQLPARMRSFFVRHGCTTRPSFVYYIKKSRRRDHEVNCDDVVQYRKKMRNLQYFFLHSDRRMGFFLSFNRSKCIFLIYPSAE